MTAAPPPQPGGAAGAGSRLVRDLGSIPNVVSLSRIALVCAGAVVFLSGRRLLGLSIGIVGGLSDYLDGYLARRLNQVTELGELLDRLSDLVFESIGLIIGIHLDVFSPLLLLAYLLREFVVLSARLYCAARRQPVPSSFLGKLKTNFLAYSFVLLGLGAADVVPMAGSQRLIYSVACFGVGGGLICSYLSGWRYLRAFVAAYDAPQP